MRWRLRLGEFDFRIHYKKVIINTQADFLSRLRTLGSKTIPIDEYITCFLRSESDDEDEANFQAPLAMNIHTPYETFVDDPDTEVTEQLLLTSQPNPTSNTAEPALVPIFESELQLV